MTEVLKQLSQTCHLVIICETICAPFSADWEGGAERSDTQVWRQQWIYVWGGSSVNTENTWLLLTFPKCLCSSLHVLYSPPGFLLHHRYLSLLILFPLPLQASWSDGFVSSVVRTQQDVTELLSQVRTSTETHWLIITLSEYTHQVIRN